MCGIAGIAGRRSVNERAVHAMMDRMSHRGPDGEGIWSNDEQTVCFGHRRLAIIDLKASANQPMVCPDGSVAITYNGEIYNYREVRSELLQLGHRFRTESDTEVLLEAYRAWGTECLQRLNGMFAFAIYDRVASQIFCARDRFGEKPFLYAEIDDALVFASEFRALMTIAEVRQDADHQRLLRFAIDPTDAADQHTETVFTGIRALPAAHFMVIHVPNLKVETYRYWNPRAPKNVPKAFSTFDDAASHFRYLLDDSIRLRLRSDVEVGSCLSGGLDSSAITCVARSQRDEAAPYHVFTGRFPGVPEDEGKWAEIVVEAAKVSQHESLLTDAELTHNLQNFLWDNELPTDSASQFAQWSVFRKAKEKNVTVLLDGQGADEILGGYEQYFIGYLNDVELAERTSERHKILDRYPGSLTIASGGLLQRLPIGARQNLSSLTKRGSSVTLGMNRKLLSGVSLDIGADPMAPLVERLERDACHGFLATLLRYGDRNSMAHSREVRLPFCDHRIAEFAFAQPASYLMGSAETKRLLRGAMKGILPEEIRTRWRKQGFLPPIAIWLQGSLGRVARDLFQSQDFCERGLWRAGWWQDAMGRFEKGDTSLASAIWKAMAIELWYAHVLPRISGMERHSAFLPSRV